MRTSDYLSWPELARRGLVILDRTHSVLHSVVLAVNNCNSNSRCISAMLGPTCAFHGTDTKTGLTPSDKYFSHIVQLLTSLIKDSKLDMTFITS